MTTLALILAFGLVTIAASAVLVPRMPTLQLQLAALALLAVCLPLAVVLASGLVMLWAVRTSPPVWRTCSAGASCSRSDGSARPLPAWPEET